MTATPPRLRLRSRLRLRRSEGGVAAVEAAIVTPLFLSLIFAIVEFGPAFLTWSAVKGASKDGVREASSSGQSAESDYNILRVVQRSIGPVTDRFQFVIVYKATGIKDPVVPCITQAKAGSRGVPGVCNIYRKADFAAPKTDFGYSPANITALDVNYPALDRKDYTSGPPDYVGVYVSARYGSPTGLLGNRDIVDTSILQIEARRVVG